MISWHHCSGWELNIFPNISLELSLGESMSLPLIQGGVVAIKINWDCNLDLHVSHCKPDYSFQRLDPEQAKIAQGYNFRYV